MRWWLIGAAAGIAVVVSIVLIVVQVQKPADIAGPTTMSVSSSASPTTTMPTADSPVDTAALPSFLAAPEEVGQIGGGVTMLGSPLITALDTIASVQPAHCTGAFAVANAATYRGSGYTGVAAQGLIDAQPTTHRVVQAVVAFPDSTTAERYYQGQLSAWTRCESSTGVITYTDTNPTDHVRFGSVAQTDNILSMFVTAAASLPQTANNCDRALGVRRSVVVDVRYCEPNSAGTALSLARGIAQRVMAWR